MELPKYAKNANQSKLVQITCRGKCNMGRYATVLDAAWSKGDPLTLAHKAGCLKCDYIASDPYNWKAV